ncbi:hypothetical protein ISS85_03430 [Candidatus Microgenomates bacterium]|nr:hypothetical protein [Candidatus Microgenomates bacterium]
MVKPILQSHLVGNIDGIVYMPLVLPEDFVALLVSPIDSMIFKVGRFEEHLRAYAKVFYPGFEFQETSEFNIWKNTATFERLQGINHD